MENILTQIINYLLTQSWQIAALVAVIAAVSLAVKNKSAHMRYLLWLIVLAKCLAPGLYTIPLAILPQQEIREPVVTAPVEMPALSIEVVDVTPKETLVLPPAAVTEPAAPTITERLAKVTVHQWLGLGWIVGAAVFVLVAVTKALRTNRRLKGQRRPLPVELQEEIENFFADVGLRTVPKVWLIKGIGQPFVWGLVRGSIYLPGNFSTSNNNKHRRGVLGHELSHVMRFDAAVNLLQIIAQAVYWFHPFVWWANKKIRAEREKCCDEMAIARLGTKAKDYSTAIVNTLIAEHKSALPVPSLAIAGPVKNIEDRIKTIMKSGRKFYRRPTFITIVAVLLLGGIAVPTTLALTRRTEKTPVGRTEAEVEGDWGEAVEGVKMRVRPERQTWYESETPKFLADMRNNGTVEWKLGLIQENWQVELDGVWYRVGASFSGVFPRLLLGPGDQHRDIEFSPQGGSDWNINGKPLKFTPGWHTVRLAFELRPRDRAQRRRLRVVSNLVVIEVLLAEADKREWGEVVGGLQCGLRADKHLWKTDETPRLQVVIRNVGERPWSLARPSELLYIKAEGKIWRWKGPASGEPVELSPGQALQERTILLTEDWSGFEDVRLELPPGRYPVQVVMLVREPTPPEYLRIESNVVVISIVSAGEKPEIAADEDDAATPLEAELHEIWRQRDRDLAGAEAFGKKLLEKYTEPEEQARIYYQLAEIYAQNPRVAPSKTIEYAEAAWWHLHDPVKKARLFVYWADAAQISKGRREAARICLRGLEFCLKFGLPKEKPELPAVSKYTADGPAAVVEQYRRENERQMAARRYAKQTRELIQHRQALTSQIVQWYAAEPDAFDELRELVMKYLHSEEVAEQLIAAARAYRKSHKAAIPVIMRMGPDPKPDADLRWGEATEGIRVRLRAEATTWVAGQTPKFKVDVRNDGSHVLQLTSAADYWAVEVDGVWYSVAIPMLGGAKGMSFGPDKQWYDLPLSLDMALGWRSESGGIALAPGRHTVRAALTGGLSADGETISLRAVSNPVQIEIRPDEMEMRSGVESAEKLKRIAELMERAKDCRKKGRYEEALAQLEMLLALDPVNDEALIIKRELEDMVSFRKQLGTRRQTDKRATSADKARARVYKQLDQVVDLSGWNPEMSFSDALEELKNSVKPRLNIVVLWGDLEKNAEIDRSTPMNMDPISAVRLGTALELLLKSVSAGDAELGYVVQDGVIIIATKESLPSNMVTRVYDIYGFLGPPDEKVQDRVKDLCRLIIDTVEPDSWYETGTGEGTITSYEDRKLIVLQTLQVHQKIAALLGKAAVDNEIAIEARFMAVSDNFLEDLLPDLGASGVGNTGRKVSYGGEIVLPGSESAVTEFREQLANAIAHSAVSRTAKGYNITLDNVKADFLLRAMQAHRDSKVLTAPKVMVLEGERAEFRIHAENHYISGYTEPNSPSEKPEPKHDSVEAGMRVQLLVKLPDGGNNILLDVDFEITQLIGFEERMYIEKLEKYPYQIPKIEVVSASTSVVVPDGGTVLIGGDKIKVTKEDGGQVERNLLVLIKAEKAQQERADAQALYRLEGGGYGGYGRGPAYYGGGYPRFGGGYGRSRSEGAGKPDSADSNSPASPPDEVKYFGGSYGRSRNEGAGKPAPK